MKCPRGLSPLPAEGLLRSRQAAQRGGTGVRPESSYGRRLPDRSRPKDNGRRRRPAKSLRVHTGRVPRRRATDAGRERRGSGQEPRRLPQHRPDAYETSPRKDRHPPPPGARTPPPLLQLLHVPDPEPAKSPPHPDSTARLTTKKRRTAEHRDPTSHASPTLVM